MLSKTTRNERRAGKIKGSSAQIKLADAPGSGKRERNKAQNRAAILDAARDVFTELGYDAATVRDVIRRTRLGSGTFYNYFPDKESVFRALLQESEERRLEWLAKVERGGGYGQYLRDSFRAYFEFVVSDRTTFDLLLRNSATIRSFAQDPLIIDEHARLARVLKEEMANGLLPTANAEYLASAMIGVCFEIAVLMVKRDPLDIDSSTEFVTNLFLGFLERSERESLSRRGPLRMASD